jgi:hypothetical protein
MSQKELQTKIQATKKFLDREIVRLRTQNAGPENLTFRQIGKRMDMIHEAERVGVRNMGEHQARKLKKMIGELEELRSTSLN